MVSSRRAANGEGIRTPCSQPWARIDGHPHQLGERGLTYAQTLADRPNRIGCVRGGRGDFHNPDLEPLFRLSARLDRLDQLPQPVEMSSPTVERA